MKYLKAIDPVTGMVSTNKVWAAADDGTLNALIADTDAGWLDYLKDDLPAQIDSLVASVYANWTRFQQEYLSREAAAQAFKDAGYTGDPGPWVTGFATPAGKTNQQAADLILAQAVGLNGALSALGVLRMRKYEILAATSSAAARSAYDDIVAKINETAAAIQ
jgi:hypothetical protein